MKFCLFVVTYSDDAESVEKQLDKIAKKIELTTARLVVLESSNTNFEYTDFYLKEEN